ncbi:MAG: serine/threonine-protein kinase, partial [bacterium]
MLDKDAATAQKVLASDQAILVQVSSVAQFRYFMEHAACDIWLCDLSMEGLDFRADVARVRLRNPHTRVVLTGPSFMSGAAAALLQQGMAATFVAKPWRLISMRQAVFRNTPHTEEKTRAPTGAPVDAKPAAGDGGRPAVQAAAASAPERKPGLRLVPSGAGGPAGKPRRPAQPVFAGTLEEPRYELGRLLGEGGVGKVYLAHDLLLDTQVAIKVLQQDFVRDAEVLQALKDEARICMQLTHPHIVRFYDFGQRSGTYFLVMEYVQGQTLHEAMQARESRTHDYVRNVAVAVGSALSYAHAHGVLHNDITPGNVLIGANGMLKLIDFGIASAVHRQRKKTQFIFGTPSYMSPEQLRCDPVLNATTDVFALGVLFHQMLTGLLPQLEDATHEDLALRPRPPVTSLAAPLAAVLDRALAFDPARRWQSVAELVGAFDL